MSAGLKYAPITATWLLARARLKGGRKYYGAYLGGFPERARVMIGCSLQEPLLHVCGGMARLYPYPRGFGRADRTLDMDIQTQPDYLRDARSPYPSACPKGSRWGGILIDPPYSKEDARHYRPGEDAYPEPNLLVRNGLDAVPVGGKVGIIHYIVPQCPDDARFVALVSVFCGFNNRMRAFSVYEKTENPA